VQKGIKDLFMGIAYKEELKNKMQSLYGIVRGLYICNQS
jgi:hypothetical protein